MVLIATFIVVTGNTIPKRIATLACRNVDASRLQAFYRLAGWTWVLTGLALGLAWLVLPQDAAGTATLIVVPAGMAVIAFRWLVLRATGRPTP
jgi:hypothetical protein